MSPPPKVAALTPPAVEGWDFGDFPYGLEPLTLPDAGHRWTRHRGDRSDLDAVSRELVAAAHERKLVTRPVPSDDLERLFWFRWIVGHHISFIIWRLLADAVAKLSTLNGDLAGAARSVTRYVRGYSAMLLYTGSCTQQIYNATIRPSMYRLHDTFSGTWSADYPAVRSIFRGRRMPPTAPDEVESLRHEIHLSRQIHLGVASKLVTNGRSLLQDLVDHPALQQPRIWTAVFDCYFLTVRAPASDHELAAQMLRRFKAVVADLATNGLRPPSAAYPEPIPDELLSPDVMACEREIVDILAEVVQLATETLSQPATSVRTGR